MRPLVGRLLLNTVGLVVAASLLSALVGVTAAWLVERTDLPGRKVWGVLAAAPLAVPAFIASYAWVSLSNGLQDFGGALLVVTCAYCPLVYLPVAAALRGLDPALEESARSLGLGPSGTSSASCCRSFARPSMAACCWSRSTCSSSSARFRCSGFAPSPPNSTPNTGPASTARNSSALALVLIALCVLCLVGELKVRGAARYARVGGGARRIAAPVRLGWTMVLALLAFAALVWRRSACRSAWSAIGCCTTPRPRLRRSRLPCRACSTRRSPRSAMASPAPSPRWSWRRRWAISRPAIPAGLASCWSGSPISRKACRASSWRWPSFRSPCK